MYWLQVIYRLKDIRNRDNARVAQVIENRLGEAISGGILGYNLIDCVFTHLLTNNPVRCGLILLL